MLVCVTLVLAQQRRQLGGVQPDKANVKYGDEATPWRLLDVYSAQADGPRPCAIFVHGGGWTKGDKRVGGVTAKSFTDQGITFISVAYRLEGKDGDDLPWPGNASDIAAAVGYVLDHADDLNIDPTRVTLMGHSAGAHLAAIVATDAAHLQAVDHSPAELWACVPIDGAGYDLMDRTDDGPVVGRIYEGAFGTDAGVHEAASPTLAARRAATEETAVCPRWLLLHAGRRPASRLQSQALRDAVISADAHAATMHNPDEDHGGAYRSLANADDPELLAIIKLIESGTLPAAD